MQNTQKTFLLIPASDPIPLTVSQVANDDVLNKLTHENRAKRFQCQGLNKVSLRSS